MINYVRKMRRGLMLSLMSLFAASSVNAAVVEHIGDRYIINVSEMNLNGDETIMDVLLMCPDVITLDAKTPLTESLYGQFAVRVDNIGLGIDTKNYLTNTRAREVEVIKICQNPGVMKGCGGLKQVIDINLRKGENGTTGRVSASGDSYGGGSTFISALHQQDNMRLFGVVEGNMARSKDDAGITNHGSHEGVKLNLVLDITPKDNLELDFTQMYDRNRTSGNAAEYDRYVHLEGTYMRTLSDAGAYALFQFAGNYGSSNSVGRHTRYTDPLALFEFSFPVVNHNLWVTAGVESGYDAQTDCEADYTNRSRYEDIYAQIDWKVGNWGFMIGDRFRVLNFWENSLKNFGEWEHTTSNHAYTASAYYKFNEGNTLQGTFARRYYNADYDNFIVDGMYYNPELQNLVAGKVYTKDYDQHIAYISELKYTYSKPDFVLGAVVKNIRQDLNIGHDNTFGVGTTAFWHKGVLRLNVGFNYFWQKTTYSSENKEYNNFVNLKLAPQVSLADGWRFTSTMLYNSRKAYDSEFYTPANFYADVAVSKSFGKNWLVEGKYHDIAGQHTGNRAVTLGVTYYWGK